MDNIGILERLECVAQNGKFKVELVLWKRTIESLIKKGLKVTILKQISEAKYRCKVSWEDSKPVSDDVKTYTIANNLFVMASQA